MWLCESLESRPAWLTTHGQPRHLSSLLGQVLEGLKLIIAVHRRGLQGFFKEVQVPSSFCDDHDRSCRTLRQTLRMNMVEPYLTTILWFEKAPELTVIADAFEKLGSPVSV